MSTLFTKIINGEIPCQKIYEDEYTFAFLDIRPNAAGHTLIVPKIEVDYFLDVPEPYYTAVFQTAKKIAPAIQQATGCKRIGMSVVGFEIPHFHLHLVPINTIEDMHHINPKQASNKELATMKQKICSFL